MHLVTDQDRQTKLNTAHLTPFVDLRNKRDVKSPRKVHNRTMKGKKMLLVDLLKSVGMFPECPNEKRECISSDV